MIFTDPLTLAETPGMQADRSLDSQTSNRIVIPANVPQGVALMIAGKITVNTVRMPPHDLRRSLVAEGYRIGIQYGNSVSPSADRGNTVGIGFDGRMVEFEHIEGSGEAWVAAADADKVINRETGDFLFITDGITNTAQGLPPTAILIGNPDLARDRLPSFYVLNWITYKRVLAIIFPTPSAEVRLTRPKIAVESITGQNWITARSPNKVLSRLSITLNNDWRDYLHKDLAELDKFNQFAVWPCGIESVFRQNSDYEHRQHDFVRNVNVRRWTGFYGYSNIDALGASGTMEFAEIAWPSAARIENPVITREPTIPTATGRLPVEQIAGAERAGTPAEWADGTPMEWRDGTPIEWSE